MSRLYLTKLAETIGDRLKTSTPEDWGGGIVVPSEMPVVLGFDPMAESGDINTKGVYVTPGFSEYNLSLARRNETKTTGYTRLLYIVVSIVQPFEVMADLDPESVSDVGKVSEWSLLRNLQDDLEYFLIQNSIPGVKLETIEPEQPLELALDQRVYLAPITLGYKGC